MMEVKGLKFGIDSPNLLVYPELLAQMRIYDNSSPRYFQVPTPGKPNNVGQERLGPIISDNEHHPEIPTENGDLLIRARIDPSFDPVAAATLRYRVMFESEVVVPFLDDGRNADGLAGDGIYGVRIPASAFSAFP